MDFLEGLLGGTTTSTSGAAGTVLGGLLGGNSGSASTGLGQLGFSDDTSKVLAQGLTKGQKLSGKQQATVASQTPSLAPLLQLLMQSGL